MEENYPGITPIKKKIEECLKQEGVERPEVKLDRPSDLQFGDIASNAALRHSRELKTPPQQLAEKICQQLNNGSLPYLKAAEAVSPGFINITLSSDFFAELIQEISDQGREFGRNSNYQDQSWVIEHTSPNPNKAMHLGHLRNNLIGMGIIRALAAGGAQVTSEAVDNNRGIAIAKLMYGFLVYGRKNTNTPVQPEHWHQHPEEWLSPDEVEQKPDHFAGYCYTQAQKDLKSDPETEQMVRRWVADWEAGEEIIWKLWEYVLSFVYQGQKQTLERLDSYFDHIWHEHQHYNKGKQYIEQGLKKGIFQQLEDGAVLTNLESYGLSDTIVLKRDGTSLYITQDIALTALKKEKYQADKMVWVIGPEQSLAMQQLFAICEQLGIGKQSEFTHITYGYVSVKDRDGGQRKMSSREGTEIFADDLLDEIKERLQKRLEEESEHQPKTTEEVAEKLTRAAVKFSFLKPERKQSLAFDPEQSIQTTGDSGIYVIYSYVRTRSILRKKPNRNKKNITVREPNQERELLALLSYYPEAVKRAQEDLSVHHLAQYLLELCAAFNKWYEKESILDDSNEEEYKLALTKSVGQVIKNGLEILGIETLEEI